MEQLFNKLVRDNIPDKIKNNGEEAVTRVLSIKEYKIELYKKLEEEKNEVINSKNKEELIEELADLLEVLDAIMSVNNISKEQVNNVKEEKRLKRGGFDKRIYLEKTISNKD